MNAPGLEILDEDAEKAGSFGVDAIRALLNELRSSTNPAARWRFDYTYRLPFTPRGMTVIVESTVQAGVLGRDRSLWGVDETYFLDGDETVFAKATTKWSSPPWGQNSNGRYASQLLSQVTAIWLAVINEFLPQPLPSGFLTAFSAGQYTVVEKATSKLIIIRDLEAAAVALRDALETQAALFLASDSADTADSSAVVTAFPVDNLFQPTAITRHEGPK